MRTISAFVFMTINGFFKGPDESTSWHSHGAEGNEFSKNQLEKGDILLFGRKTFELMRDFWPTKMAFDTFPEVADSMSKSEKLVMSSTLKNPEWDNTEIIEGDAIQYIKQLKSKPGKNITILGSGSIINQLSEEQLIDRYEFLIDPVALNRGTSLFGTLPNNLQLKLITCQSFPESGMVLITYEPR